MSSFNNLVSRSSFLNEAKVSPYAGAHPAFAKVTKTMADAGLSSAPLDTIKFIREILYYEDIIDEETLNQIKKASGFSGKKKALLDVLNSKREEINAKSDAIANRVQEGLSSFISGTGVNRSREEKYAAQAAAKEIEKEVRAAKATHKTAEALKDLVSDESILIKTSAIKVLANIRQHANEPDMDIDEEAISEVEDYIHNIDTLEKLKSFIKQIANEPGYEKIAAYLSDIVKPVQSFIASNNMSEEEENSYEENPHDPAMEEWEMGDTDRDDEEDDSEEYDPKKADINRSGEVEDWEEAIAKKRGFKKVEKPISESYTSQYITEQVKKDKSTNPTTPQNQTFKERYKPKTSYQLDELRRYGL